MVVKVGTQKPESWSALPVEPTLADTKGEVLDRVTALIVLLKIVSVAAAAFVPLWTVLLSTETANHEIVALFVALFLSKVI